MDKLKIIVWERDFPGERVVCSVGPFQGFKISII